MKILSNFRLFLNGKTGKETRESSRLEFLEKFLGNNFVYQMQKTSSPLNSGGIANLLC